MQGTRASTLRSLAWFFLGLGWGAALMLVESGDELSRAMLEKRELEGEIARLHKLLAEERERPLGPTAIRRLEIHFVGPPSRVGKRTNSGGGWNPSFANSLGLKRAPSRGFLRRSSTRPSPGTSPGKAASTASASA